MKKFSLIIVGLGNIGLKYDLTSGPEKIFTHTRAFNSNENFNILFGVDPDNSHREMFKNETGKPAYAKLPETVETTNPLIVVIATPSTVRKSIIKESIALKPKLIVLEKPISTSHEEAQEIVDLCRVNNTGLFVNYIRRCEPSVNRVKKIISEGLFGELKCAHGYYTGGLFNSCSHFIDLMLYWFGEPDRTRLLNPIRQSIEDPALDFILEYRNFSCVFQALQNTTYSTISLELVFESGVIRVDDFGRKVSICYNEPDPDFDDCFRLGKNDENIPTQMDIYQENVVNHIFMHLTTGTPLVSTGETAYSTLAICHSLLSQMEKK